MDKKPEPVVVEVESNSRLKSDTELSQSNHSTIVKNTSGETIQSSSINSTSKNSEPLHTPERNIDQGTVDGDQRENEATATGNVPVDSFQQKEDDAALKNHTSAFCLPAKPLVSGEPTSTYDGGDEDETHYYFKGNTGRCIAPDYSCLQGTTSTPLSPSIHNADLSESHCYLPRLVQQQESEMKRFRVVQIHRRQSVEKQSVLFVGNVWDLVDGGVRTSDFVPRDWWFARLLGFAKLSAFPRELETVLLLTAGLSAGLAVVNMLPIYGLDGYHIVDAVVHASVSKGWEGRRAARLVKIISWVALAIALLTIFCSVSLSL